MATPQKDTTQTGRHLIELLTHRRRYRSQWERRAVQRTFGAPSQAAVARVVADYLVDSGERSDTYGLHRQIKDRVARLFGPERVSAETLGWFIAAFGMADDDARRLWELFEGAKVAGFVAGGWPPPTASLKDQGLRTVSLHELHSLGADGCPASHRTVQVIQATTDWLKGYLYRFDTNALDVEVARGGQAGPITDLGGGMYAVEITFNAPLQSGMTASLEYLTTFRYSEPPPPEFRRGVIRRIDNLEIRVQFHPARLPAKVWWGSWDTLDGPMADRETTQLDSEFAVHRYLDGVEAAIVGFAWAWEA